MESGEDDANIGDDEVVLRRVSDRSHVFDENLGRRRPSSDTFLQGGPEGLVSVYLESETTHDVVARGGPEPHLVSISVGELRELELGVVQTLHPAALGIAKLQAGRPEAS